MIAWFKREYASLFKEKRLQEKDLLSGKKRCWSRGASWRSPLREGLETGKQEVEFYGIFFFFCFFALHCCGFLYQWSWKARQKCFPLPFSFVCFSALFSFVLLQLTIRLLLPHILISDTMHSSSALGEALRALTLIFDICHCGWEEKR